MRVISHPILGEQEQTNWVFIQVDGEEIEAREGEPIAAAIIASGRLKLRHTHKYGEPRGVFCGIGRCTDCVMTVNGLTNVRTCVTPVREGMIIHTPGRSRSEDKHENG